MDFIKSYPEFTAAVVCGMAGFLLTIIRAYIRYNKIDFSDLLNRERNYFYFIIQTGCEFFTITPTFAVIGGLVCEFIHSSVF